MVGSGGRCSRASWLARRWAALPRWAPDATIASMRARICPLCNRGSRLRDAMAARDDAISSATASCPSRRARARTTTSRTFSAPNASQLRNASSRSVSGSSEYGTCSVEHDVETATVAAEPSRVANVPNAASRSVRQTLRPSTTPATSVLPASSGTPATEVSAPAPGRRRWLRTGHISRTSGAHGHQGTARVRARARWRPPAP